MAIAVMSLLQLAMCMRTACAQDSDPSAGSLAQPTWAERDGLAVLAELHHIAGGVVGERSVQGGDEAIGVEGERDAKGRFPRREPGRPLFQPAGAHNAACVRRLHDVGGGSSAVEHEAAGQSDTLVWLAHVVLPFFSPLKLILGSGGIETRPKNPAWKCPPPDSDPF